MVILKTFRGWRYNLDKVDLEQVIAPPYDVIDPDFQERLYDRDPHNVVRLILGKQVPGDNERENCTLRASRFLTDWMNAGILIQERVPSFYLYRQTFRHPETARKLERSALGCLVKLAEFKAKQVFSHEETSSEVKEGRLRLLSATEANLSPVFGLYEDEKGDIRKVLKRVSKAPRLFGIQDGEGVQHSLQRIDEGDTIRFLMRAFQKKRIVLADGHHRYETALAYRNLRRRQERRAGRNEFPYDFLMMALVAREDSGLMVLPTHRLIQRPVVDRRDFNRLGNYFKITKVSYNKLKKAWVQDLSRNNRARRIPLSGEEIGLYLGRKEAYWLQLLPSQEKRLRGRRRNDHGGHAEGSRILPVLALDRWLGHYSADGKGDIEYTHSYREAVAKVDSGAYHAAFLMRPISLREIMSRSFRGERFPRKTTYFYPKLASGILFYSHRDAGAA